MPPSQLKRLKSSLREQGVTGPQKSKKQKKAAKSSKAPTERAQKQAALQQIRDSFNPFEIQAPTRPAKFPHASISNGVGKGKYKDVLHRPGASRSVGEDMRRATLLPEVRRRSKVGGLVDRRIGEGDTDMTAEERAVQRFAEEKQRRKGGASLFDLEGNDDDGMGMGLTHGGRRLDDLAADDMGSLGDSDDDGDLIRKKRRRSDDNDEEVPHDFYNGRADQFEDDSGSDNEPERKKSKREVMDEVVAKSKFHKYERQKAKEDDDDLREELDKGMDDMLALLRGHRKSAPPPVAPVAEDVETNGVGPAMNPDRLKLLNVADRTSVAKEYDARLKQLGRDQKAKPSDRTKTEEEKAQEEAERLKTLEERRAKRMRGEEVEGAAPRRNDEVVEDEDAQQDDAAEFGFTNSTAPRDNGREKLVLEDEDEFALDEDLIASGSDIDMSEVSGSDVESDDEQSYNVHEDDEEDEFVKGIFGGPSEHHPKSNGQSSGSQGLAFTYPCPRSHAALLNVVKSTVVEQLPTVIQRIRALHHPSLNATNKESMADFSVALVEHLSYMGLQKHPLGVTEQVIRHLHSLSRTYPEVIASAFRKQLREGHERKDLHPGDLAILTAVGSIYPTSDHFHQVVTPAMTLMAKWLAMNSPGAEHQHSTGIFLIALCLHYQRVSRRFVPDAVRYTLRALRSKPKSEHELEAHCANIMSMAELWKAKPAFIEIFEPLAKALEMISKTYTSTKHKTHATFRTVTILLEQSRTARQPLQLHKHRPLAIRQQIPKFEETFDPNKHYDPDKDRSDAKKLQREYKREKKGAIRELRKDSRFLARENLGEKRERDQEYEKKQRRLIAEIQGEEGREAKEYEREKGRRKRRH